MNGMLDLIARNDLIADPDEKDLWKADGDDPHFLIRFPILRRRYIAIRVTSREGEIEPRLYANHGRGFEENDSLSMGIGQDFLVIADVGSFGTICSLRFDPANESCLISVSVEGFSWMRELDSHIASQKTTNPSLMVAQFNQLPRFWKRLPKLSFHKKRTKAAAYMRRAGELAAGVVLSEPVADDVPWLSIVVPVYNAPASYLNDLVESLFSQEIAGVELILSDDGSDSAETLSWFSSRQQDPRIRALLNGVNRGIALATNSGLKMARGEWVALLDHDDVIAPHGLRVIRHAIETCPSADFFYTDELVVDERLKPIGLMLKSAYDPVLLSGVNYINHFSIYRRKRLEEIGLLRTGFEGSQDYDLLLRYLEGVNDLNVIHVPYPAYWWRRSGKTYSRTFLDSATANARKALLERFLREGKQNNVAAALTNTLHRVRFPVAKNQRPKISIIIPNRNSPSLMSVLLSGIYERTAYDNLEVIVIDNGSTNPATLSLYEDYAGRFPSFSYHIKEVPFNFSRAINEGMACATGEHFLLLNNDVEIIEGEWLDEMVECLAYDKAGIVGAKLLYANRRIQHAGVITGLGGLAGHWYLNKPENFGGPLNRLHVRSSMTCVTGAVMLISGDCVRQIGAWDEENFAVAYNDVDYCLRAYKAGFRIIWTPFASLIHHESVSRGSDTGGESRKRFDREKENLRRLYHTQDFDDPTSSPGFSKDRSDLRIVLLDALPEPRRWFSLS